MSNDNQLLHTAVQVCVDATDSAHKSITADEVTAAIGAITLQFATTGRCKEADQLMKKWNEMADRKKNPVRYADTNRKAFTAYLIAQFGIGTGWKEAEPKVGAHWELKPDYKFADVQGHWLSYGKADKADATAPALLGVEGIDAMVLQFTNRLVSEATKKKCNAKGKKQAREWFTFIRDEFDAE